MVRQAEPPEAFTQKDIIDQHMKVHPRSQPGPLTPTGGSPDQLSRPLSNCQRSLPGPVSRRVPARVVAFDTSAGSPCGFDALDAASTRHHAGALSSAHRTG